MPIILQACQLLDDAFVTRRNRAVNQRESIENWSQPGWGRVIAWRKAVGGIVNASPSQISPRATFVETAGGRRPPGRPFVLTVQAMFYVVSGLWSIVSIDSFMRVTGRKRDVWLV